MNFKFPFIFSLAPGTVFLDAIRLVEHGNDQISLLDKLEWAFAGRTLFIRAVYCLKYLKRGIRYSYGHPGSFNPAVIMNKEAQSRSVTWTRKLALYKLLALPRRKGRKFLTFILKRNSAVLKVSLGFRCLI